MCSVAPSSSSSSEPGRDSDGWEEEKSARAKHNALLSLFICFYLESRRFGAGGGLIPIRQSASESSIYILLLLLLQLLIGRVCIFT